jgi:hypothetical protein
VIFFASWGILRGSQAVHFVHFKVSISSFRLCL